jgi:phenylpropionate dioxygenase-like ring-hydroxylating dioxygenase large terminal subunit
MSGEKDRRSDTGDFSYLVQEDRVHRLLYTDPELFRDEMRKIFGAVWVYVAHESQIPKSDDFISSKLGLRPIIVVRDSAGIIRILFNRCTHRGATVCRAESGSAKVFQCPYHGWTYRNSGKLNGVPWPEGYAGDFDDGRFNLAQAPRVANYRGFIFATLNDSAPAIEDYLGPAQRPLDEWLDRHPGGRVNVRNANRLKFKGNWKLGYDNAADGYHVVFSHRSLLAMENRLAGEANGEEEKGMAFYKDKPDEAPMYVQYLGNGHHYKDKRGNVEDRPGALWEIEGAHPGMERLEATLRRKFGDAANRLLDLAASEPVNINIFPNLSILGNHIQVFQPVAVDETDTSWYATAVAEDADEFAGELDGAAELVNMLRMRTQENFPSFGEVDDLMNFEQIQAGLAAEEDEWVYMHRGLGIDGRISRSEDGVVTGPATDELFMREYMKEYRRLMTTDIELSIARDPAQGGRL